MPKGSDFVQDIDAFSYASKMKTEMPFFHSAKKNE